MKFQVDNITVNILETSPPSTQEEDLKKLAQYVYCFMELGIKREKERNNSHSELIRLIQPQNEQEIICVLQDQGIVATNQQCEFCGGSMRIIKDQIIWFWLCSRREQGVKYNKGKLSIF